MRHALVGVLGHVDHGKTALVRALTGTDTDRLPEEKARGISIVPGFARLLVDDAEIELVDVPGHERFLRAMVAGASAIRAALLVVDAAEGVRAQTVEHLEIARLLGVTRGVVAVTRIDRVPSCALPPSPRPDWPLVATSAVTGEGIAALREALAVLAEPLAEAAPGAWLPVDRVFSLAGVGTVVTGALRRGVLRVGDAVEIMPAGRAARIRALQRHGAPVAEAREGQRVAVALRGVARDEVAPGDALAAPGSLLASARLDVALTLLDEAPDGAALRLLIGTAEVGARLHALDRAAGVAQLRLDQPVAAPVRTRFVLRLASPPRTIGGGEVLHPSPPRRRARDAPLLAGLAARDAAGAAALLLDQGGMAGMAAAEFARLGGAGGVTLGGRVLDSRRIEAAEAALLRAVPAEGAPPATLRNTLPPGAPLEALLARLVSSGRLVMAHGVLRQAGAPISAAEGAALAAVESAFRAALFAPPEVRDVVGACPRRAAALRQLLRAGLLLRAPDAVQKREIIFHRDALDAARRAIRIHFGARPDGFRAGECGRLLGISRRFAIPLLERLDAERFTRREGNLRRLAETPMTRGG